VRRLLPLAALVGLGLVTWALLSDLDGEALRARHAELAGIVAAYPVMAPAVALLVYAAAVAACLPVALWITLALGFAFGTWWGGLLSVAGGTLGSVLTFLVTRTSLGSPLRQRAGPWLARVEGALRGGMWGFLLAIRLVPVLPAWVTNTVPALLNVPTGIFVLTTALGIAPATFVLAGLGAGLAEVFAKGGSVDLSALAGIAVLGPIAAGVVLAAAPLGWRQYRRWRRR